LRTDSRPGRAGAAGGQACAPPTGSDRCYGSNVDTARIRIRRIAPTDGLTLRDLRVRSIAESPNAFGQPLAEALARPDLEWQRSARQASHGEDRTWLIAEETGRTVGIVQGRRRRPSTLMLFSMWVDPSARRLGVGRMLIGALETWASGWQARETLLWVMADNHRAIEFYRGLGFDTVDRGPDAQSGARFGAIAMRRTISAPPP
jgi:ribosomal protein S18 acetylase RimI-like enzyme